MKAGSLILLALAGFITFFGCDNFALNHAAADEESASKGLEKYNYIFRVVDISNSSSRSIFSEKINAHEEKLEQLAGVFANTNSGNISTRSVNSAHPIINNLASAAFTAYTVPEVQYLVSQLASEGVYIQFSYKEFLIDQCVPRNSERSIATSFSKSVKNVLEFDGSSTSPMQWAAKAETITFIETAGKARTAEYVEPELVTLQIAPENKAIVDEYMQEYSQILLADQNSIVTEQPDGSYIIVNGDTESVIETTDTADTTVSASRGLFSLIKKAVSNVVTTIKKNPVVSAIAITCTVIGFASGAGLITLPAGLLVSGNGLTGTIGFVFFL
jgi:hypothetical protein